MRANVEDDDVAVLDFAIEFVVMERGGIGAGADDGCVAFGFGAAHGVNFDHFCGDLIFKKAGMHHFHGGDMPIEGEINGFLQESDFAGGFDLAKRFDLQADVF